MNNVELPIQRAARMVGGQAELARLLGVTPPTVSQWVRGERQVPAERCPQIEAAVSGAVTCEELRADVAWHVLRKPADRVSVASGEQEVGNAA